MNKQRLVLGLLMVVSTTHLARASDPMIDAAMEMFRESGNLQQVGQCLDKEPSLVEQSVRAAMKKCLFQPDQSEAAVNQCMESTLAQQLGVSKSILQGCEFEETDDHTEFSDQYLNKYEQQLDELYQQIGDNEPTAQQQAKIDALIEQMTQHEMEQSEKELAQFQNFASAASANTMHLITLPIYENSEIIMHITEGGNMEWGDKVIKTLPAATFSSSAPIEDIIAFYKTKLPNFKAKQVDEEMFLLMESMPEDFNLLKHIDKYSSTPNISISKRKATNSPKGTQAIIEIAYRR